MIPQYLLDLAVEHCDAFKSKNGEHIFQFSEKQIELFAIQVEIKALTDMLRLPKGEAK